MPENEKPNENLNEKSDKDIFGPEFEEYIEKNKEGIKSQPGPISVEDGEKAKASLKKVMDIPGIDIKNIHDLEYLYDIFSEKYDGYKSLSFLKKTRKKLLDAGYTDTPALNAYLFWTTIERRLHIVYQNQHKILSQGAGKPEDMPFLKQVQHVSELVAKLSVALETSFEKEEKERDVVDIHKDMIDLAKKEIKGHIGEFVFKCQGCDTIVNTQGLPYWAIETKDDGIAPSYYVFSPELWYLLKKDLISMHLIAFILRTSPEGILWTAKARGEKDIPKFDIDKMDKEEQSVRKIRDDFEESEYTTRQALISGKQRK